MFLNGISEFESKFKMLDRLNSLVFNVWRDKNAIAYRDGDMARITNEYRHYISDVRSLSEEVKGLERKLENTFREIEALVHQVNNISGNPEIQGCRIYEAWGENTVRDNEGAIKIQRSDRIRFVAKYSPDSKARELLGDSWTHVSVSGVTNPL